MESRGSETPACGRAPGSSETRQSCVSVCLIFRISTRCLRGIRDPEEGSGGAPRRSRAGLPGPSLTGGLHRPCPCTRLSREALGPCSPPYAGVREGDRTLPAWGEVTWSAPPAGAGHSRACRHAPPWAQGTGEPRSPGKQPCSRAGLCTPHQTNNKPPRDGPGGTSLGRRPPGLGLSPGSPRHLSWSWGSGWANGELEVKT